MRQRKYSIINCLGFRTTTATAQVSQSSCRRIFSSSTSKTNEAPGGMAGPLPSSPYLNRKEKEKE